MATLASLSSICCFLPLVLQRKICPTRHQWPRTSHRRSEWTSLWTSTNWNNTGGKSDVMKLKLTWMGNLKDCRCSGLWERGVKILGFSIGPVIAVKVWFAKCHKEGRKIPWFHNRFVSLMDPTVRRVIGWNSWKADFGPYIQRGSDSHEAWRSQCIWSE